ERNAPIRASAATWTTAAPLNTQGCHSVSFHLWVRLQFIGHAPCQIFPSVLRRLRYLIYPKKRREKTTIDKFRPHENKTNGTPSHAWIEFSRYTEGSRSDRKKPKEKRDKSHLSLSKTKKTEK